MRVRTRNVTDRQTDESGYFANRFEVKMANMKFWTSCDTKTVRLTRNGDHIPDISVTNIFAKIEITTDKRNRSTYFAKTPFRLSQSNNRRGLFNISRPGHYSARWEIIGCSYVRNIMLFDELVKCYKRVITLSVQLSVSQYVHLNCKFFVSLYKIFTLNGKFTHNTCFFTISVVA